MDNLRLALLIMGCFIVLGIYLWEIFFRSSPKQRNTILDAIDEMPDISLTPVQGETETYSAMVDLANALTQARDQSLTKLSGQPEMPIKPESATMPEAKTNAPSQPLEKDIQAQEKFREGAVPEAGSDHATRIKQHSEDPLVLYITSSPPTLFDGVSIRKAVDAVGMVYGSMSIFHHFGSEQMYSEQPLFSIANIHEPGSFDLERMVDLKTKGIAIFMYSSPPINADIVFELYLSTAQRVAELLGGNVRTIDNQILNATAIDALRKRASSFSNNIVNE